jgi:hypothetical protein
MDESDSGESLNSSGSEESKDNDSVCSDDGFFSEEETFERQ